MPERLSHGITIRRLWRSDRAAVLAYFLRLDPETRANRFMGTVSEAGVRAYAERVLTTEGLVFGAFADGILRGLGELRPDAETPMSAAVGMSPVVLRPLGTCAEAAFAVERPYRRNGIGSTLFERIAESARNRGVVDLHVRCLSRNAPMRELARKHGADLHAAGSETDGALHLPQPTPFSFWHESIASAFDITLALTASSNRQPIP